MLNHFLKHLVDIFYGTNRVKRKYQVENPTETVLAADASKAITTNANQDVQRGLEWVFSQRAVVLLTNQKIVCGKWVIPLTDIQAAQLIEIKSLFGKGQVLRIQTKDNKHYQFGMQVNPEWTNQQGLPLTIEKGEVKHSVYSIAVRVIALAFILYWLYEQLIQN